MGHDGWATTARTETADETERPVGHIDDRANVAGRTAVVAGGAAGLGRACARDLGRAGMRLALADRDAAQLESTAAELRAEGIDVSSRVLDVRDADALTAWFHELDSLAVPRIDVLVNVVGGTFRQPFEESEPKGWEALIRANFTWLLTAVQLAIPRLRAAGGGSIINLTSIEGHRAAPNFAVYAAMKAAVASLTTSLALELAADGIRINCIAPDFVPTGGAGGLTGAPTDHDAASRRISVPMGRAGTDEDIGGCALFLASDLSSFITGQTLHPDGGVTPSRGWYRWPDEGWRVAPPASVIEALGPSEP